MLISLNWIKDFVELPSALSTDEIVSRFTESTAEVESVIARGQHLSQVRVVRIESILQHPDADKLRLVTFTLEKDDIREVVCGAPNIEPGMMVPYAPVGITLPNGLTLEKKKIRGVVSEGMLCSPAELEVGEDASGIWELPADAPLGASLQEYLEQTPDFILELDNKSLTHRPDLWGHFGLAREFAAVFDLPFKNPFESKWQETLEATFTSDEPPVTIDVQPQNCCLGYFGISVDNVEVKPSPPWMQERLLAAGLRPINNMVDIGNYVMLETGGPLHIFDRNKIRGGKIIIEALDAATDMAMLDGSIAKLEAGDTVVSDTEGPLVIGGIMGGESSGVSESTASIFIEAANWDAGTIRRTSNRLGMRTDSSQRFEKGLDILQQRITILRALELVRELCPGCKTVGTLQYDGPSLAGLVHPVLKVEQQHVSDMLGMQVTSKEIEDSLTKLGFGVTQENGHFTVQVPSYRATRSFFEYEAEVIEEVGRVVGYGKIDPTSPIGPVSSTVLAAPLKLRRAVQDFLFIRAGALEVCTYPLVGADLLEQASWPIRNEELTLLNPISQDRAIMRPSLVPSLLEAVALNQKHFDSFRCFELGRSYVADKKDHARELTQVAIAFHHHKDTPFVEVLDLVEDLLRSIGLPATLETAVKKDTSCPLPLDWTGCHPNEYRVLRIMGKSAGAVTSVHPLILREFKIRGKTSIAVIDLTEFEHFGVRDTSQYTPLAKFPSSTFDCSVEAPSNLPVEEVLAVVRKLKAKEILDCRVADIFQLPDEKKSVTVRTVLGDQERTLSGELIKEREEQIVAALDKAGFPLKK